MPCAWVLNVKTRRYIYRLCDFSSAAREYLRWLARRGGVQKCNACFEIKESSFSYIHAWIDDRQPRRPPGSPRQKIYYIYRCWFHFTIRYRNLTPVPTTVHSYVNVHQVMTLFTINKYMPWVNRRGYYRGIARAPLYSNT